jgi:hypothetical protein
MKIRPKGSQVTFGWESAFRGSEWHAGFIYKYPSEYKVNGHGCGPCEIFGGSTQIELKTPPLDLGSFSELSIAVEMVDISDLQNPYSTSSFNSGAQITVTRGI